MTRLLLINPNISDSVSALIRAEAGAARRPVRRSKSSPPPSAWPTSKPVSRR